MTVGCWVHWYMEQQLAELWGFNLLVGITGLAAGYMAKRFAIGKSKNILKKMMGSILQLLVSTLVVENPEVVVALVKPVGKLLSRDKESENSEN